MPSTRHQLITARNGAIVGPIQEQSDWLYFLVQAHNLHYRMTDNQLYARRQQRFVAWIQRQQQQAKVTRNIAV